MKNGIVLDRGPRSNLDQVVVGPAHGMGPYAGSRAQLDAPDHYGQRVDVGRRVDLGNPVTQGVDGHQSCAR